MGKAAKGRVRSGRGPATTKRSLLVRRSTGAYGSEELAPARARIQVQSRNWLVATGLIEASAMIRLRVEADIDAVAIVKLIVIMLIMFA
jgi:hypothetical protein